MVENGLESFIAAGPPKAGCRAVLLSHQAAVDRHGLTSLYRLRRAFPKLLGAVWGPQHGYYGDRQANMIASDDFSDPLSGLPVYSLYGDQRSPTPAMLEDVDLILIDLVDVGCRVYTYVWTMFLVLRAVAGRGIRVVILDRPNPLGGRQLEGNLLAADLTSFVGLYPLPMRHGLTMGELALYLKDRNRLDVELEVVPVKAWERSRYFDQTGLLWVLPSPNLPVLDSVLVYPGQVLLEGCNLSEGRGTTLPFSLCGAPWVDPRRLAAAINPEARAGLVLRPTWFRPTFDKWQGQLCGGLQLHVSDRARFSPYFFSLELIRAARRLYPRQFKFLPPPYEYEYQKMPFDILTGSHELRKAIEDDVELGNQRASWRAELESFRDDCQPFLLYR